MWRAGILTLPLPCFQGGMKAVVWTDTFQVVVLYVAMLAVLIKGTIEIGGLDTVWRRNADNGRADLFK